MRKTILHLCADIGSDSYFYQKDDNYDVILIGKDIGVENVKKEMFIEKNIIGIIANPPCTEFSTARSSGLAREDSIGFEIVDHCIRIINELNPKWWIIENPARGTLKKYLGEPLKKYEPWHYGSPWSKETALWGNFVMPDKKYIKWEDVPKNEKLYIRPKREKPSLAFMHKSAIYLIEEFKPFIDKVDSDMSFRSLCSQNFAKAFKECNK